MPEQMTLRAIRAIEESEYVIGNESYLAPLLPMLEGKSVIRSSMGKEVDRAKNAIELARDHVVSMVSGGDPGVYGMASIVLEIVDRSGADTRVEVIPGVTAANASASLLGSPLSGDFAVISLSDLLTPLEVIEKRLKGVFSTGIPVVLYNPRSRGRPHNFALAVEIAQGFRGPDTPVGIVRNAYREGEEIRITTLSRAVDLEDTIDMHSAVIIGGEESRIWRRGDNVRGIITPRGYHRKYVY
jgi:precorrin-3B C17-methyltransferase